MTTRSRQAGYSLVALMASITIMMLMMGAALPAWRYVMKEDREQELIFRGTQIADAILRYQKDPRNGNQFPPNLEVLVKGRYLRKNFKDPLTQQDPVKKGAWRVIHQGEPLPGTPLPGTGPPGTPPTTQQAQPPQTLGSGFGAPAGTRVGGPIVGVASTSTEKSLRVFNGKTRYSDWAFVGNPEEWVIGSQKPVKIGPKPLNTPSPGPFTTPSPVSTPQEPPQEPN